MAQKWAQYLANTNTFKHSGASGVGENIYMSYGLAVNGKTAVDAWYAEVKDYNCASPGFSLSTGHFTQVVWVGSKQLGNGMATSKTGATYVVANYSPPGNYQGQFPANVLPAKGSGK